MNRDIDKLDWETTSYMKLNKSRCQFLYLVQGSFAYLYRLGDKKLQSSPTERDLGVLADDKLNLRQQCALADQRSKRTLWCIRPKPRKGLSHCAVCCAGAPPALGAGLSAIICEGHKTATGPKGMT